MNHSQSSQDSKALSRQRYGQFAQSYVTSPSHARGRELERLVEMAQPQPDWFVLDVATGGGHTALQFAPFVAQVIATDITPNMLQAAQAYAERRGVHNVTFELADAECLPFEDQRFDLVTCRIAPHHFPDCARFVGESARVLKAEGTLLVQDHVLPEEQEAARYVDAFERLRDPSHHRAYAESEWEDMFRAAGLVVRHREQIVKRHAFLPWAERQGCTQETIERLIQKMRHAPQVVVDWMEPRAFGKQDASFANHHILIAGRRGETS